MPQAHEDHCLTTDKKCGRELAPDSGGSGTHAVTATAPIGGKPPPTLTVFHRLIGGGKWYLVVYRQFLADDREGQHVGAGGVGRCEYPGRSPISPILTDTA